MRRFHFLCAGLSLVTSVSAISAPPDRGGGGTAPAQFTPEISYLWVDAKGNRELRLASRDGTAEVVVTKSPTAIHSHDLSSEQVKLIAYTGSDGVNIRQWQVQPLQIGAPRRIFSGEVHYVDFSPDDAKLVFSTGTELYVHDLASGTNTLLFTAGVIANPRWSPDGSGDIFFFGGPDSGPSPWTGAWDLQKYSAATGTFTRLRADRDGFVASLGMDVSRPSSAGGIYDDPHLVLAYGVPGSVEPRLQFFNLDGSPRATPNIPGSSFHYECTNNRVIHHLEQGRNDAIGMTHLAGTPAVWKKDSRIRTAQIDWMRRVPCQ